MLLRNFLLGIILSAVFPSCNNTEAPLPVGPLPSERQLAWHDMQYYAFVHFNMNTFTDMEWGTGGESPELFDPSELDTRQWARVAKEAGMQGIILTAKHHDGFCLWPTKTTEHSVKNSPWRNGEGDVIAELAEACEEYGLKLGLYLSPWDRNNEHYGKPEYVAVFHEQLRELLTNYGDLFEVWFDGANGGSGYYGGAEETRKIDNRTYYQWEKTTEMIRELQPDAVIFSDGGPDVRWVGNEEGWANPTNWSIMRRDEIYPGWPRYIELRSGHEDGTHWLPAEADISIRPGWYYHPGEDHQVKSLPQLVNIYYESIGRNANLLLNLPVDTRGLVHESDVEQLMALKEQTDLDFAVELAAGNSIEASNTRGNSDRFAAENATDGNKDSYWATDDGVTNASLTLEFEEPTGVNRILLQEYIPLGQRIKKFRISALSEGQWQVLDEQTTIGYKRILRFNTVMASKIKLEILEAKGPVTLSNLELYNAPPLLAEPAISRDRSGKVTMDVPDRKTEVYYTLDGTEPGKGSAKYEGPFNLPHPATLRAIAVDPQSGKQTRVIEKYFDIPKASWVVIGKDSEPREELVKLMDDDPQTFWATGEDNNQTDEVTIDLGNLYDLKGFTYWPMQARFPFGLITRYEFYTSRDNKTWQMVSRGEFGNIANNRIEQRVEFKSTPARYIRLRAVAKHNGDLRTSFGEIGVITGK